ncbi:hypothetical protein ZWY2020_050726 [Hordeum vulgare]|nr:hypothetical protein ZWY2020_050724 [Hordeum vulgare]KAI4977119.1 hypothetical protein ZWY2020_050726 [Hordeum vulgare]
MDLELGEKEASVDMRNVLVEGSHLTCLIPAAEARSLRPNASRRPWRHRQLLDPPPHLLWFLQSTVVDEDDEDGVDLVEKEEPDLFLTSSSLVAVAKDDSTNWIWRYAIQEFQPKGSAIAVC